MRNFLRALLLAAVGFAILAKAGKHMHTNVHDNSGLSDILGALGIEGGGVGEMVEKGESSTKAATKTVIVQGAAAKGNATCAAQKTITITKQAAAAAGTGNLHLSFVTKTVFGTGAPKTVTVTALPEKITKMITVTVSGAAAAGIITPGAAGAVETVGIGNGGVTLSAPGVAASPVAAAPAVGSPGAIANGMGTLNPDGSCACSCLCGEGSFPNSATAVAPAIVATTLYTVVSSTAVSSPSSIAASSPSSSGAATSSSTATASSVAKSSSSSTATSSAVSISAVSSLELSIAATRASSAISSGASYLQLSLTPEPTATLATAATDVAQPQGPLNISTFPLSSSLILGNLATATMKV